MDAVFTKRYDKYVQNKVSSVLFNECKNNFIKT